MGFAIVIDIAVIIVAVVIVIIVVVVEWWCCVRVRWGAETTERLHVTAIVFCRRIIIYGVNVVGPVAIEWSAMSGEWNMYVRDAWKALHLHAGMCERYTRPGIAYCWP